jgi:hypothetical protein
MDVTAVEPPLFAARAFELPAFVGYVLDAGYAGPIPLEVFDDVFREPIRSSPSGPYRP